MWTRRVDLAICEPMTNGFRFAEGLPVFENRVRCLPDAAPGLKAIAADGLDWLEEHWADQAYIAGNDISLADIHLFAFIDFAQGVGQPLDPARRKVTDWYHRMKARDSAAASMA
jgi:glutathione S-transferase